LAPSTHLGLFTLLALLAACQGPALHIDNPEGHTVFLDGVQTTAVDIPFRYFGTTRWDAQPVDRDPLGDWSLQPASKAVTISAPVSPVLFPFDLPLELLVWVVRGTVDTTTVIELPPTPAQQLAEAEGALGTLVQRAQEARVSR
jgi:hypothetical protein